ncbi:MAG: response regulator [Agarilytica sp.]
MPVEQILLVEDDVTLGAVTKIALEKRGYSVEYVGTNTAALSALDTAQADHFTMAILDLKLEDETTLDIIPRLRAHAPEMKILMLTAYASIATAVEAVKLGANNYLPKPANVTEILEALGQESVAEPAEEENLAVMSPKRLEWEHIQRVLLKNDGNVSATARELNMHRRTLQRKLQKHPVKE